MKSILPTITSATICALILSNCATIKKYRKDPSEWNIPEDKPKATELQSKQEATPIVKTPTKSKPIPSVTQPVKVKNAPATHYNARPLEKIQKKTTQKKTNTIAKKNRRVIGGLLTPDADRLPSEKDLLEVESMPTNKSNSGVNIPVKP